MMLTAHPQQDIAKIQNILPSNFGSARVVVVPALRVPAFTGGEEAAASSILSRTRSLALSRSMVSMVCRLQQNFTYLFHPRT